MEFVADLHEDLMEPEADHENITCIKLQSLHKSVFGILSEEIIDL